MANTPSFVTEEFKQKLTATVLAESFDSDQAEKIRWIYYANTNEEGGLDGLKKSTAYKETQDWYMVYLYLLGDKTNGEKALPRSGPRAKFFVGFSTVAEYCEKNAFAKGHAKPRAVKVRKLIDEMYTNATNPYVGWTGQGSMDDINRGETYWKMVRCYYWLQVDDTAKEKKEKYVEILPAGIYTQFIFDGKSIEKYFKDHPLPKEVKKFTIGDVPR